MNRETNMFRVLVFGEDESIKTKVKVTGVCEPICKCQIRESKEVISAFDTWLDGYKASVAEE